MMGCLHTFVCVCTVDITENAAYFAENNYPADTGRHNDVVMGFVRRHSESVL